MVLLMIYFGWQDTCTHTHVQTYLSTCMCIVDSLHNFVVREEVSEASKVHVCTRVGWFKLFNTVMLIVLDFWNDFVLSSTKHLLFNSLLKFKAAPLILL